MFQHHKFTRSRVKLTIDTSFNAQNVQIILQENDTNDILRLLQHGMITDATITETTSIKLSLRKSAAMLESEKLEALR